MPGAGEATDANNATGVSPPVDHLAGWLADRRERLLDELASELAAVASPLAGDPTGLLQHVVGSVGGPAEITGFWAAACRHEGCSWSDIAAALGISRQAAHHRFTGWAQRFARVASTARSRPAGLPAPLTGFVGREAARRELPAVLQSQHLVCLSGPAGVGKSRLAAEVASMVASRYADGTWWVDLAPVRLPDMVDGAVAKALGVQERPGRAVRETLVTHLATKQSLVVLDNCEHVIAGCARLVNALLAACPSLSLLATSREPLGLAEETVWPVPPLSVPSDADEKPGPLADGESVALFCQRALSVLPGFVLDHDTAWAVGDICRRLDGLPLAIELAAARVAVVPPAQIAALLAHRFELLTVGPPTAPSRQRTLRAALDWSYALLDDEERALLRRLGVFTGGWTLEAAEATVDDAILDRRRVLDVLSALVAKSLVVADTSGRREARYRFLETMRAYALERLDEAGEADAVGERHATWCLALAERAEPELTGAEQGWWLERLEADHANLRQAFAWLTTAGEPERAARLAGSLTLFWRVRGHFIEGRAWLTETLASTAGPCWLRAKLLWGAGFLARMVEDPADAGLLEAALSAYRELGDARGTARALLLLGNCTLLTSPQTALPRLEDSAALARETADAWCLSHALGLGGLAQRLAGDLAAARSLLQEGVAVARRAQDPQGLRLGLTVLGDLTLEEGDCRTARALLVEALELVRDLGDVYGIAVVLYMLGDIAIVLGDRQAARRLLAEALAAAGDAGNPAVIHNAACCLGRLELAEGDTLAAATSFELALRTAGESGLTGDAARLGLGRCAAADGDGAGARARFEEVLESARDENDKRTMAGALHQLGGLALVEGDLVGATARFERALKLRADLGDVPAIVETTEAVAELVLNRNLDRAARLYGAAQAIRDARGYARGRAEQERSDAITGALRRRLTGDRFATAWNAGRGFSPERLVAEALRAHSGSGRPASGWAALTPSERQVATLAAQGLTNPEIATQLIISRHTVHGHLSHVFDKLAITSRRELAGLVAAADI